MDAWHYEHEQYRKTDTWKAVQRIVRRRDANKCTDCGCTVKIMDVHHTSYIPAEGYMQGGEIEAKICRLLCRRCHKQYDGTKRRENIPPPIPKTQKRTKLQDQNELRKQIIDEVHAEFEAGLIHDFWEKIEEISERYNYRAAKLGLL